MTTRYAVLINAGLAKGQKVIEGPTHDVRTLRSFLTSVIGGAWESGDGIEIKTLNNPDLATVQKWLDKCNKADFSLVAFSGHGGIEDNGVTRKHKVILGSGESVVFSKLKPTSDRCIMLCDSCRKVETLHRFTESIKMSAARFAKSLKDDARQYRRAYDRAIAAAPVGTFTMYGCAIGEYSFEDMNVGGYFTTNMIAVANEWAEGNTGVLTVDEALELAKPRVTNERPQKDQHPKGGPENRSGNPFPWAVNIEDGPIRFVRGS